MCLTPRGPFSQPLARLIVLGLLAAAGLVAQTASRASADSAVPYSDPNAQGVIGLCDRDGKTIDHGNVTDRPFVWAAVGSTAAPADYAVDGRTATLFAFQPRQGLEPGQWSGQMLTASARYDNPRYPKAQATDGDDTLADFIELFPAKWHGLVQLRLLLGAPGVTPLNRQYAATDIQITGNTWKVVRGGSVPCTMTNAVSIEDIYEKAPTTTVAPAPPVDPAAASSAAAVVPDTPVQAVPGEVGGAAPTSVVQSGGGKVSPSVTSDVASSSKSNDHTSLAPFLVAVLVAALVGLAAWLWYRRRGGPAEPPDLGPGFGPDAFASAPVDAPAPDSADDSEESHVAADSAR